MDVIALCLLIFGVIVTLTALIVIVFDHRMNIAKYVSDNFDGSYTVTVSIRNPRKIRRNPKQLKIAIKEGKALFLKQPEIPLNKMTALQTLFVVVVNESSLIEVCYGRKKMIISGKNIAKSQLIST